MDVTPAFWAGRSVLVTGHTGFKGGWLTLWLSALGARVIGLADTAPVPPSIFAAAGVADVLHDEHTVDVRQADRVYDAVAAAQPDIVLHLAAQPFVRRSYDEPVETFATNVQGTVHVLDAVRRVGGVDAVVVVTSDKCYDQRGAGRPFTEDDPMGGHDPYSASKGAAELITSAYRSSYFGGADGTQIGSARAGNVIGGGDWGEDRLVPDIIRAALSGEEIAVRRPGAVRPWQHVLNPLEGYLLLAQALCQRRDGAADGFNFGPDQDDAQPVQAVVERLVSRWPAPLRWSVDGAPSPHEAGYLALDSSRARARLGWTPRWSLDRALDEIVDWSVAYAEGRDMREVTLAQIAAFASTPV